MAEQYSNYPTKCVHSWLDADGSSRAWLRNQARDTWDRSEADPHFSREERASLDLSVQIRMVVEAWNPIAGRSNLFADLLAVSLRSVNWYEIANRLVSEVAR